MAERTHDEESSSLNDMTLSQQDKEYVLRCGKGKYQRLTKENVFLCQSLQPIQHKGFLDICSINIHLSK